MTDKKYKIDIPLLESDFRAIVKLVGENVTKDVNCGIDYYKSSSLGEVIIAKNNDQVIGIIKQSRPGKIFEELEDNHFDLDNIKAERETLGIYVGSRLTKNFRG
jgi:hypothetical protein